MAFYFYPCYVMAQMKCRHKKGHFEYRKPIQSIQMVCFLQFLWMNNMFTLVFVARADTQAQIVCLSNTDKIAPLLNSSNSFSWTSALLFWLFLYLHFFETETGHLLYVCVCICVCVFVTITNVWGNKFQCSLKLVFKISVNKLFTKLYCASHVLFNISEDNRRSKWFLSCMAKNRGLTIENYHIALVTNPQQFFYGTYNHNYAMMYGKNFNSHCFKCANFVIRISRFAIHDSWFAIDRKRLSIDGPMTMSNVARLFISNI